jgi:type IV pilus assembly protein PilX
MEQLISRRLPARRAQSGVALIMVLIMLTAMAIAGVALVRVVDSANVISGNFAFRQSTLNIADLGVEAATADLVAIHGPAADRESAWPVGCEAPGPPECRYFPVRSINLPNLNCNNAPFPQGCGLDGKGLPVRGNTTWIADPPLHDINWDGNDPNNNDVPAAPRGYRIRYVIDRQCNRAPAVDVLDDCSNLPQVDSKKSPPIALPGPISYRVTVQVTGPRNTQSHVQVFLSY